MGAVAGDKAGAPPASGPPDKWSQGSLGSGNTKIPGTLMELWQSAKLAWVEKEERFIEKEAWP